MFDKILIANRGEIAVRIIRACREMGIKTVAVFSEPDREALHAQLADEAVCIGSAKAADSYNNMNNIISAAVLTKAQAIHPGFGFLSENSTFAAMCKECNIKFIGPDPEVIDLLGNKANARTMMQNAQVPVIPGSDGVVKDIDRAYEIAEKLGYPVMVKASAGGGGKGIRIVRRKEDLAKAFESAKSGEDYGNVIHLGERDCSLQRKNQKVLEEAPSPAVPQSVREELCAAAVRAAKAAGYQSAGTIEFLYDRSKQFYFMEMNTRVQVEHPVTQMITGVDIIKEQIRIADGKRLSIAQKDVTISGHAIECRINAENPDKNFAPCPGTIEYLLLPAGGLGLRVDTAVYEGYEIPPYYDSMIAKVIVHGRDRKEAIAKMKRALYEFIIKGIDTNIAFQEKILNHEEYIAGDFDTTFLEEKVIDRKD